MFQSSIRSTSAAFDLRPGFGRSDAAWIAAIVSTVALILLVNPVGYRGGGSDDFQYLEGARCWIANGPCLPHDHWQGRWPIIAPLAASIALLGETRWSVGLPSLLYALGAIVLLARLGNRLFDRPVGYIAALFLASLPFVGIDLLDPNIDGAELFLLLASANCAAAFAATRRPAAAFAAGLLWSLAFQARETAVIGLLPLAAVAWLTARRDVRALILLAAGAALPLLIEFAVYAAQSGDPLWRRHLSVAHTSIASSELRGVDTRQSPFFNRSFIAHWRQEPGIHFHWALDGLINLVFNLKAGIVLPMALVVVPASWTLFGPGERRAIRWLALLGLGWACALIFALAIDPKPRMMSMPLVAAALALALALRAIDRRGLRRFASLAGVAMCIVGLVPALNHPAVARTEPVTRRWAAAYPRQIETDATGLAHLALDPARAAFAPEGSGRPYLMLRLEPDCGSLSMAERARLTLVDRVSLDPYDRAGRGAFCLFRRRQAD